jgi:transposase
MREKMRTKPIPETAAFGIDIVKKLFLVVALNAAGAVIQRAKFSRDTQMAFFDAAPKGLVGMQACLGS